MSDDVTSLAEVLAAHHQSGFTVCRCGAQFADPTARWETWNAAHEAHVAEMLAPLLGEARLIGAAQAKSDAIEAYDDLRVGVEALIAPGVLPDGEALPEWVHVDELRALIDTSPQVDRECAERERIEARDWDELLDARNREHFAEANEEEAP